jgi:hypothetical protein
VGRWKKLEAFLWSLCTKWKCCYEKIFNK